MRRGRVAGAAAHACGEAAAVEIVALPVVHTAWVTAAGYPALDALVPGARRRAGSAAPAGAAS